jgi:superfamily II DNA or RNA helicase
LSELTLTVENSECKVTGFTRALFGKIRELLSCPIDKSTAFYSGAGYNTKKYLITKNGVFPTGLLYLVKDYFKKNSIPYEFKDLRKRPESLIGRFKPRLGVIPYPEQILASKAAVEGSRGIITLPTGTGKSLVAALIINELQVRTLVVTPNLALKQQLTETLMGVFGKNKVGEYGSNRDIVVENVDALSPGIPVNSYDCVILDEFHHAGAATYRKLSQKAWNKIYYRFGLTATPFRSMDAERLLLESVLSEVIYRLDYQTSVDKGYIVPVEAYYIELPKQQVNGNSWTQVYSELVVRNDDRNSIISNILFRLSFSSLSALCLVKEIAHGQTLSEITAFPFANGQDGNSTKLIEKFNDLKSLCLIGTTGVVGEGVDTRPCEYVIIAGLGKSKNQFMQQIGRALRRHPGKESAKIIIFKDKSHRWTLAHFRAQVKILEEEYGCTPVKLDI